MHWAHHFCLELYDNSRPAKAMHTTIGYKNASKPKNGAYSIIGQRVPGRHLRFGVRYLQQ